MCSLAVLLAALPIYSLGQVPSMGIPFIEHFSPEEYKAGILNYKISQDQRGLILVCNNLGMLEYDGTRWRRYEMDSDSRIRCMFPDPSGKIYVGAQNDLGFFWPDPQGRYTFHSLKHLVPESQADFSEVWNIYRRPEGIVFAIVQGLLIYDGSNIDFVPYDKPNMLSHAKGNRLFNQVMGKGLLELDKQDWLPTKMGAFFSEMEVRGVHSYDDHFDLISTYEDGLFLMGMHDVKPWASNLREQFSEYKILCAERLSDGNFAIGTNADGLYILNDDGALIDHLSKGSGLKSKTVLDIFEDSHGNIWIGQNNGISKIEWRSPFRLLNEETGLSGTGYVACTTDKYIYFGTNNGLYYYKNEPNGGGDGIGKFEGIERVYSIQEINGQVLVGCHIGAFQIKDLEVREISSGVGWWTFTATENPDIAIGGGYAGLFLLRRYDGYWEVEKHYAGFTESSRIMEFDDHGTLWMSHGNKGVYALQFDNTYDNISDIRFYNQSNGFPSSKGINVQKINSEITFSTTQGIYSYHEESDSILPNKEYNDLIGQETRIRYLIEGHLGDIFYIGSDMTVGLKETNWGYDRDTSTFTKIHSLLNDDLEKISILDKDKVAFAVREGFVLYDKSFSYPLEEYAVILRCVYLNWSDSALFDGNFIDQDILVSDQPSDAIPRIRYDDNSLRFRFSAVSFDELPTRYKYRLSGLEEGWSQWTTTSEKEYMALREGTYTFEVIAKNSLGVESNTMQYQFAILPPWYRKPWLVAIYFLAFVALCVWLIFFARKNKKIISAQEQTLATQDRQLKEVSEKSEEEINRLKHEKLTAEIRNKKNELASTTMNLIDRNDYINSIQKSLNELLSETKSPKAKLKRIISEIEKNKKSNQDWSQFELLFDEANDNFSKKIRNLYPTLTPHEVRLCIYLRMKLNTKEVANLSHVTPRAVEMSRHRLRKKLGIGKETNLYEFLVEINDSH